MNGYEGWTNWDTWAVALWADNDESLYARLWSTLESIGKYQAKGQYDEVRARAGLLRIAKEVARYARKRGEPISNKAVNWDEIVDSWLAEWEAEKAYYQQEANQ